MWVKYAILTALVEGPMHGYAIQRALQRRLGLLWTVNHGQVYATLARLASDGLIGPTTSRPAASPEPHPSREYELLPAGFDCLEAWRSRPSGRLAARGELLAKAFLAATVGGPPCLLELIARQRERSAAVALALREEEARRVAEGAEEIATALARRAALGLVEADIEWLALVARDLADACTPRR